MELALILMAPTLQIVFSILRIYGRINMPIAVISFLALILAFFLSLSAGNIVLHEIAAADPLHHSHCGMPGVAVFFGGVILDAILILVIGLIGTAIYSHHKSKVNKPELQ